MIDQKRRQLETHQFLGSLIGEPETLGSALKTIRECDEISQVEFAKMLGVSKSYLCDLENNRKPVSVKKAAEFAKKTGYSAKFFVQLAISRYP